MAANRTYRIRGNIRDTTAPKTQEISITTQRRLMPGSGRDASMGELVVMRDEVVRVELENGFVLWTRADELIRTHGRETVGRDGATAWEIVNRPPARGGTRGLLGLGIRVLDFFGIDLKKKAAGELGKALEDYQLKGKPGLYRCAMAGVFSLTPVPEKTALPAGGSLLVFIHGTASCCEGSFGKMWEPGSARDLGRTTLHEKYGERIYAWEHRSFTESPIRNALELAKRLPKNAELHLVSHSRGGLVGELLCLAERDRHNDILKAEFLDELFKGDRTIAQQIGLDPLDENAAQERDAAYDTDRKALSELISLLDEKEFKITRFVRVGCPVRGTTLASGRLDRWLSVLNHFTGDASIGDVADFMLAVVKERTDPRTLPGLEAMMPGSALTRLLQQPITTTADLSVIAGDVEDNSLWGQIKLFVADWFYGADHDLVVNTGSMYGGLPRTNNLARFLRDQGPKVNHFNYFENDKSVRWLVAGLTRANGADGGFQPILEAKREEPRWRAAVARSRSITTPRPLAVVLPGTMGSELQFDNQTIWLNYWKLFRGGLQKLHGDAQGVIPCDLLDDFYGPLLEFLTRSHRVEMFPYDWRLSVRDAAKRLAESLETWLTECERQNQPLHLIAHSMGGLVVRAMIADGGRGAAVWQRILKHPNSRFMMLGTPNLGSYEAVRWLTGYNATQGKLSLLDFRHGTNEIIDLVRAYPGLVELLPFDPASPDFSQPTLWSNLKQQLSAGWEPCSASVLSQARATWDLLKQAPPDPQRMIYIAGCQEATVVDYQVIDVEEDETETLPRKRLEFFATRDGDGTVAWKSGFLPGVPVWYVEDTAHDELCAQKRAFPGYLDLLMSGATTRLPASPPAKSRAAAGEKALFIMPTLPPTDGIPAAGSLRGFGFGPGRPFAEAVAGPGVPLIQVSIRHGNLAYAKHPVLVGHYRNDTIVGSEKALDERLDKALSSRQQLGIYPGRLGTHALFFHSKKGKPGGAVVVGLGQVGELSPGLLTKAVRDALLDYALRVAQWPDDRFGPADSPRSAALSCLLVGSGAGGIEVRNSMEAILRAAVAANAKLVAAEMEGKVIIDHLEFLELYEDIAISAAEALESVLRDGQLAQLVVWNERVIVEGEGCLRRVRSDEVQDWWQRLEILDEDECGILRFIATTDRARAEETLATGQMLLADGFIRHASNSPAANAEVAKTLFEMLLPNRLKELAPKQVDLVLLVDNISARYPWELLEDRWSNSDRPPAIAAGLVRQLKTLNFRPQPAHATEAKALIIGNPDLAGWDKFGDLPGARHEAQKVTALLNAKGYHAQDCIDESADSILAALHKDAWRILHLAGHGEHEFVLEDVVGTSGKSDSGMVIGKHRFLTPGDVMGISCKSVSGMVIGKNTFLTPGDVEQMRWVPELVFINCCHLGKTLSPNQGKFNLLAANLAVQFIQMGVKAVVAAGWAVDDAAAQSFAVSFYTHMLAGSNFGSSVRAAREEIWMRFPEVNTWGAYQCYGDPGYRLHGDGGSAWQQKSKVFHAPVELIAALDNHTAWIRMRQHDKDVDEATLLELRDGIASLLAAAPNTLRADWLARADVAAAIGFAWGETGACAEAVEWLDKALHAKVGDCSVRAAEQCANFRVRLAGENWLALREQAPSKRAIEIKSEREQLIKQIKGAISELDMICQRAETPERLSLLGSAYKRLAWVSSDKKQRLKALGDMAEYYYKARNLDKENPYPFANWVVAKMFEVQLDPSKGGDWQTGLDDRCLHMMEVARSRNVRDPNFWNAVGEPDCELARLLINTKEEIPDGVSDHIIALYCAAARRGASPREYASVLEHLDFVIDLSEGRPALRGVLQTIRAAL